LKFNTEIDCCCFFQFKDEEIGKRYYPETSKVQQ